MKDTPKEVLERWRANLDSLSSEERVKMACSMFEFARDLVVESIRNQHPEISDADLQREVLKRFYGNEVVVTR